MWTSLSLQTRLSVVLCALLAGACAIVLVALVAFSISHLRHEREPAELLAAQFAGAISAELRADPAQHEPISRLLRRLNEQPSGNLRYVEANLPQSPPPRPAFEVPSWFSRLVDATTRPGNIPVAALPGQLMLYPGDSADVYEKWIAFLAITLAPLVLGLVVFAVSQRTVRTTLQPLRELSDAISKLRDGDYGIRVAGNGPPEIRRTGDEVNALAVVLTSLRAGNQTLGKRIVRAQDDERAEIGRELHDEFGPLLFAARANAHALQKQHGDHRLSMLAGEISGIVEAIQVTNSRLLARLRPLDLVNVGLVRNIAALIDSPAAKASHLTADFNLDPAIDTLDELSARTVYRFVQEALTNVMRHAMASKADILARVHGSFVTAEVSDDGAGMPEGTALGRGLEGMRERIGILGGTFTINSNSAGTVVRCTLPVG
jgi:two-component system sensor histidine kinase UhpB